MCKIDLHTHSIASPDGGLNGSHYRQMLESGALDYIAVTDHNTIDFALQLQKELGDKIIIGEEITTTEGELTGLYLKQAVPCGRSAAETVQLIKKQGGLVYVPHPFETVRQGLPVSVLDKIAGDVDIVEVYNGRAMFQNMSKAAHAWTAGHNLPAVASSDAHGWHGWGRTYSIVTEAPSAKALAGALCNAQLVTNRLGMRATLYPKMNRIRKAIGA